MQYPKNRIPRSSYDSVASLYDFEYPECAGEELEFWDRILGENAGRALELAVGTGRVALPLASRGHEIYGVDVSQPMLDRAQVKRSQLPTHVQSRAHFSLQDMRNFVFRQRFQVIYAAFNSLLLLSRDSDFYACLDAVTRHLVPSGIFVAEIFSMNHDDVVDDVETLNYVDREPESGAMVTRQRNYSYNRRRQEAVSELSYELTHASGEVEIRGCSYTLQLYTAHQLLELVSKCGFSVRDNYGTYARDAYVDGAEKLIIVCEATGNIGQGS